MIKIIQHGTTYQTLECFKCKCKFGFTSTETKDEYDPHYKDLISIRCPECNQRHVIKKESGRK